MTRVRRPLALSALLILLVQVSGLIAGPVTAGCRATAAAPTVCCKAAEHQSGPCPMHARSTSNPDRCRIGCDRRDDVPVLLGMFAFLPPSPVIGDPIDQSAILRVATPTLVVRTTPPDSPPPEARG
jgi:hypothetical protein